MNVLANVDRERDGPRARAERIVDIVFAGEPAGRGRRFAIGFGVVLCAVGAIGVAVGRMAPGAGPWSAEMAARVHDAIRAERSVELTPPAPPPSAPSAVPAPPAARAPRLVAKAAPAPTHERPAPAAPAQAGALAAVSEAPADFTGTAFVVGNSVAYAGGTTMRSGTSQAPVAGAVAPGGTGNGASAPAHSLARPATLKPENWPCNNGDDWPSEADALQINEQTVVVRVRVRADGRAERVDVIADPGFGFGQASRTCALRTHFDPELDDAGHPVAATLPLRVRFSR
jgi:hypothetical protein